MKYAHIYNAPGKKVQLLITSGPQINAAVLSTQTFNSKREAKAAAKLAGATAWNY